ncbi:MAG: DUF6572 domain-containing protein [Planctomycetaceae bacterium]
MSLEDRDTIDAIGLERKSSHVVLTIADSWTWDEEHQHLLALQSKVNAYFEFIESGRIWETYRVARDRQLRINIVFRFGPPAAAMEFLEIASEVASELGILMSHEIFREET